MRAIIFAAGLGTRLRPLTETMPKALVPLAGKTLLQYQIEALRQVGITDIIINIHHKGQQIIDYVEKHEDFGCHISFSDERDELLNTGGGLLKVIREQVKDEHEPLLTLNVDILSNIDLRAFVAAYDGQDAGLVVVSERQTQRYLCFDEDGYLSGWTNVGTGERLEVRGRASRYSLVVRDERLLAFSGMQVVMPERVLPYLEQCAAKRRDFSLIDLYLAMPAHQFKAYLPANYRMMDVGKIEQLAAAEEFAKAVRTQTASLSEVRSQK